MNKYYRKPKPETMKKNRESYSEIFKQEISWLKDNLQTLTESKNKFLIDMYTILITGSRKITPKMASAIKNGIEKCKNSPLYNPELQAEAEAKLKPILEKIVMVERLAEKKNDKAQTFVRSVKQYVQMNYRITKKQMEGLNKVYKRCSEDLFKKD
tara:strand:+ start:327 stop:791 length:465 start_codon:yes stop_codon:yes gene_type:complete